MQIDSKYAPYCNMDKSTRQERPYSDNIYGKIPNESEKTILLIRDPFEAIYALKQLLYHDDAYYHLFGKGNIDIYSRSGHPFHNQIMIRCNVVINYKLK